MRGRDCWSLRARSIAPEPSGAAWAVLGGFLVCVVMAHRLLGWYTLMAARERLTSQPQRI